MLWLARRVLALTRSIGYLALLTVLALLCWWFDEDLGQPVSMIVMGQFWLSLWAGWEVGLAEGTAAPTRMRPGFIRAFMLLSASVLVGGGAALLALRLPY